MTMLYMKTKSLMIASVLLAVALTLTGVIEPDPMTFAVVGVGILDVFRQDAFSVMSLTDAINKVPFVPGRAGTLINWNDNGVATTSIMLEEIDGELTLINPTPRGGPGQSVAKKKRTARILNVPHYQIDDAIYAEEVQGVREFGQENQVQTVFNVVNARLVQHVEWRLDPTLEFQRLGALKGIILNGDGSTLYNLFTEFAVSQEAEVDFDLDNATPAAGALRKKCAGVVRTIMNNLAGIPVLGIHAFCGDAFFDDLLSHPEVTASYTGTPMAQVLRDGYVYPNDMKVYGAFEFGGIVWENYRGAVAGAAFVNTDKCHIFPVGGAGLYRTISAPADYIETVNTIGLPRYTKQWLMRNDKGVNLEVQANCISYSTRPKSLMLGKRT
jgi:hypothetical protein